LITVQTNDSSRIHDEKQANRAHTSGVTDQIRWLNDSVHYP
jgi:hypothetical protein